MGQRHHTVPQTYLRGFSDPRGQLRAYDRLKQAQWTVSVGDAAVVQDIYKLPPNDEGLAPDAIEQFLADKESAIALQLTEIRSGHSGVDAPCRNALAEYIALQMTRTLRALEQVNEMGDWYAKIWFEGMNREAVEERFRDAGITPTPQDIDEAMKFIDNIDRYTFVPPPQSFLLFFLEGFLRILPFLEEGWNWVVVRSSRPLLTSDHPVILIGDTMNGGLGVANAQEIWLPIARHRALVLTRDLSLPPALFDIPPSHAKRICQRIALESERWVFWHPKDKAADGVNMPPPEQRLKVETVAWRQRSENEIGELVNIRPNRPRILGECLLNGRPVIDRRGALDATWQPGRHPRFATTP